MKHEKREVVAVKDVYIADDGMEFDKYNDCVRYEVESLEKKLSLYDKRMKPCGMDSSYVVHIRNNDDMRAFVTVAKYYDDHIKGIIGPGVYYYDGWLEEWLCISDIVDELREKEKGDGLR